MFGTPPPLQGLKMFMNGNKAKNSDQTQDYPLIECVLTSEWTRWKTEWIANSPMQCPNDESMNGFQQLQLLEMHKAETKLEVTHFTFINGEKLIKKK